MYDVYLLLKIRSFLLLLAESDLFCRFTTRKRFVIQSSDEEEQDCAESSESPIPTITQAQMYQK